MSSPTFQDDFDLDALGSFPGNNWYGIGGTTIVVPDPPSIASNPGLPRDPSKASSIQCVAFGGLAQLVDANFNGDLECSIMVGAGTALPQPIIQITNTMYPLTPTDLSSPPNSGYPGIYSGPRTATLLTVQIEKDLSISLYVTNGILTDPTTNLPCNSAFTTNSIHNNSFYLTQNAWYFFQLTFGFTAPPPPLTGTIMASGSLSIEGQSILNAKAAPTHWTTNNPYVDPTGVYIVPPLGLYNGIQFFSSVDIGAGCFLDNVTVGGGQWPFPATPPNPHCDVSQLVVEVASLGTQQNARISQFVVERMTIPKKSTGGLSANIRDSQLVVELIRQQGSGPVAGQNWLVKES